MKNKNFIVNLLIISFLSGFISCDNSDPAVFEKSKLIGSYTGECTVSLGSLSGSVLDFPAEFRQKDSKSLYFIIGDADSYKSIGIIATKVASGFKDDGTYAGFDLESFDDIFEYDQIPQFMKDSISLAWDMRNIRLKLSAIPKPKYTITSQKLTFTYTGIIEITGGNWGEKFSSPVTYVFNLDKKPD